MIEFFYFLLDFGDLNKSFSLGNAHASMALHSLNHDFIVHEEIISFSPHLNNRKKKARLAPLRCQPRYFFSRLDVGLIVPSRGHSITCGKRYFLEARTGRTVNPWLRM